MQKQRFGVGVILFAFLALVFLLAAGPTAADTSWQTIASGLDNPRGITAGPDGELYVAEAGRGGDGPCAAGPEGEVCFGMTGAITKIHDGTQTRVITGLPSLAAADGSGATGVHDLSLRGSDVAYFTLGLGGNLDYRAIFGPEGATLGHLGVAKFSANFWRPLVDLAGYETAENPDGAQIDSNPYGIAPQGGKPVLVDAGGNSLLWIGHTPQTLAIFPVRFVPSPFNPNDLFPMDAVPTAVDRGPDGAWYVSQLTGFPFPVGEANIYRVAPGQTPTVWATGFTNIIDIIFGPDGSLYVLEIATNSLLSGDPTGALIRIYPDGSREVIASEGLIMPGGVVIGTDGALYVTNCSACPAGAGEVVRIEP